MLICYYYQTFIGLEQVLQNPRLVDVINVSAIHFGYDQTSGEPYIHLNNQSPDDPIFDGVWKETLEANQNGGTLIHLMVGGAGSAYEVLFSNFDIFYPLLQKTIMSRNWITGIDLDIEEYVSIDDIKMLIRKIREDFGKNFKITMAPVLYALQSDVPGLGGFCYKDLYNSVEGSEIAWFNIQAYGDYSVEAFDQIVDNGYPSSKLVFGMISYEFMGDTAFEGALQIICDIFKKYPDFGGVFNWEYFDAPPSGSNPITWASLIALAVSDKLNSVQHHHCICL